MAQLCDAAGDVQELPLRQHLEGSDGEHELGLCVIGAVVGECVPRVVAAFTLHRNELGIEFEIVVRP